MCAVFVAGIKIRYTENVILVFSGLSFLAGNCSLRFPCQNSAKSSQTEHAIQKNSCSSSQNKNKFRNNFK